MKNIIRQCKGCKNLNDRNGMLKITIKNGELFLNPDTKIQGRSIYVCKNPDCIKALIKQKGIKRGLKFSDDIKIKEVENKLLNLFG